jgi:putative oxidoreductase
MSHASAPHDNAPLASSGGFDADLAFLERWAGPLGLLARAMLAYVFFVEGVGKIAYYTDVVGYMQSNGVDGWLLPLAIVTEIGGSLLVLAGFKTRWAAVALSGFCVLAAVLFHRGGGAEETLQLQKDIAIGGGFLALALLGAGPWSIDAWRGRARERAAGDRAS